MNYGGLQIKTRSGSIALIREETDRLRVGPQSAGADPRPACYAQGGDDLTITDADVLRDSIDPNNFLGGRESLDIDNAKQAAEPITGQLGLDLMDIARGVVEIANAQMSGLMRQRTVSRGTTRETSPRTPTGVRACLNALDEAIKIDENVMPSIIDAVKTYATMDKIMQVFKQRHGAYQQKIGFA
jgi:N-methylhydantoinase A/oxoprolinase/acetone carboxylase beta subunit